jgi:hypothetical protein
MGQCQRSHLTALEHIVVQRNLLQGFRCVPRSCDTLEVLIDCVRASGIGEGVWTAKREEHVRLSMLALFSKEGFDTMVLGAVFPPQLCGQCCRKRDKHARTDMACALTLCGVRQQSLC